MQNHFLSWQANPGFTSMNICIDSWYTCLCFQLSCHYWSFARWSSLSLTAHGTIFTPLRWAKRRSGQTQAGHARQDHAALLLSAKRCATRLGLWAGGQASTTWGTTWGITWAAHGVSWPAVWVPWPSCDGAIILVGMVSICHGLPWYLYCTIYMTFVTSTSYRMYGWINRLRNVAITLFIRDRWPNCPSCLIFRLGLRWLTRTEISYSLETATGNTLQVVPMS